jgi:hypothetical protein
VKRNEALHRESVNADRIEGKMGIQLIFQQEQLHAGDLFLGVIFLTQGSSLQKL